MPQFEETLLEDGYMNMYEIMKAFVKADYDGVLHADHVPLWGTGVGTGGSTTAWTYSMGIHQGAVEMCNGRGKQII